MALAASEYARLVRRSGLTCTLPTVSAGPLNQRNQVSLDIRRESIRTPETRVSYFFILLCST